MIPDDPILTTHQQLLDAPASERADIVATYLLASVRALRPEADPGQIALDSQLSDLEIDSIQVVELKFGLDQLVGTELDVELIVTNPTVRQLAERSVAAAGLE